MAHVQLELNAGKALKRKDVAKIAKILEKVSKTKKVDALILTITNEAGSVAIPFPIVEKK